VRVCVFVRVSPSDALTSRYLLALRPLTFCALAFLSSVVSFFCVRVRACVCVFMFVRVCT